MSVALWILQAVLAIVFAVTGGLKLVRPKAALLDRMGALEPVHPAAVKAIGLAEVLGALGLVVAPFVGLMPLVPWAAFGLACAMVAAMIAHGQRHEWTHAAVPAVLFVLSVVVMYGRSALLAA